MSRMKRIMMVFIAVLLFMMTAVSAYGAGSPTKRDTVTMTTDDGVEVILYKMPDNLDMISDTAKAFYGSLIDLAKQGIIELYIGEVKEGKYAGDVLIKTGYPQKAAIMDDVNRAAMDDAYTEVQAAEGQLDTLTPGVTAKAAEAGVAVEDCRVSEVFDLTYYRNEGEWKKSDDHGTINVKSTEENLDNFVSLLHRDKGEWEVVEDAKVTGENHDTLSFSAKSLSPFAVVVWGDDQASATAKKSPKTGDNTLIWVGAAAAGMMTVIAAAYVLVSAASKKRS